MGAETIIIVVQVIAAAHGRDAAKEIIKFIG